MCGCSFFAAAFWLTEKVCEAVGECDTCNSFTRWDSHLSIAGNESWLWVGLSSSNWNQELLGFTKLNHKGLVAHYSPLVASSHISPCTALPSNTLVFRDRRAPQSSLRSGTQSGYSVKDWTTCSSVPAQGMKYDFAGWGDSQLFYYIIISLVMLKHVIYSEYYKKKDNIVPWDHPILLMKRLSELNIHCTGLADD